ncbi:MAG: hypothetical protein KDA41_01865 [Planctomycetales bacterium]|nr:hypothetical protein [Planctomycetales bacterium]
MFLRRGCCFLPSRMAPVAVLLLSAGLAIFAGAHAAAQDGGFEEAIEHFEDDPSPLDLSPSALDPTRDLGLRQRPAEPAPAQGTTETAKPITHFPAQAAVVGGVFGVMVVGLMAMLLRRRR